MILSDGRGTNQPPMEHFYLFENQALGHVALDILDENTPERVTGGLARSVSEFTW